MTRPVRCAAAGSIPRAPSEVEREEWPSLGLAPRLAEEVYEQVRCIGEAGLTILVAEQNTVLALSVADRAYVL